MENGCSKRKPAAQLTKDQLQGDAAQGEQPEAANSVDMKEADADTLKNRRRLKIVRTHAPPVAACPEPLPTKEAVTESKVQPTPEPASQTTEPCATAAATAAAAPAAAADAAPAAAADAAPAAAADAAPAAAAEAAPAAAAEAEQTAAPAAEAEKTSAGTESGSSTAPAAAAAAGAAAAADAAADAAPAAAPNGTSTTDNTSNSSSNNNSNNNSSSSSSNSGGGLFGSVLKGAPAFVSPFGSLGAAGNSFLLPAAGAAEGSSLFKGAGAAQPAEAEDADVPPPEEPTRDCRMQCFDLENKAWTPKPPLDGKVDFVAPKKGEEEGLPNARILFFVNRTGRLRLNSPVLPSTVKFRHPVERSAASAAKTTSPGSAAASEGNTAEGTKEMPVKKNTVEFTGLKIDAKDAKDTTFYRIRFSNEERAAEFIALANAKQEEAAKAAQNGSTK
ncbi:hypothetical protein, conserved [Eimeria praecox]|uniref:RanBD1 domain-containing protein n=1 Tax=Eimeria praecox TaxID=51316 RepID=U6GRJ4_9EIME|nr:hypothetical protein, conserved [Eimeria praecox]